MTLECLCYWLLVWIALELGRVQYAALQLSLVLTAVLALVALLLLVELDLLALVILSTYASVFIALALLALHFGPFWLRAGAPESAGRTTTRLLPLLLVSGICWSVGSLVSASTGLTGGVMGLSVLWQDLALETRVRVGGYVGLTHWLFFRFFILETLGLNLYLFVGLVAALILLAFRHAWVDGAGVASYLTAGRVRTTTQSFSGDRLRLLAKFRRQVRRTNTSRLRHPNTR